MESMNREELYTLVWSEPITKIAPRYGLSDRGFGKLCARYDIPVPPRGYWARNAAGKRDPKPPLPRPEWKATISFYRPPKADEPEEQTTPRALPAEIEFERDPMNFVFVEPNARLTHPLVTAAAQTLRGERPDHDGIVRRFGCLDIRVSPAALSRALHVMQALVRALEQRGHRVAVKERSTDVTVLGETMTIFLRERLRRRIRDLTSDEQRRRRAGHEVDPYELEPTGELSLHIDNSYGRSRASDSKNLQLEECLNQFIEAMLEQAFRAKQMRAEREAEEKRREEAERRRKQRAIRARQERARIDRFERLVKDWRRSQERQTFLTSLREAIGAIEDESPLAQWLSWVEHWTEVSDPLNRFRRRADTLKLYFAGYGHEIQQIKSDGFSDPEASPFGDQKVSPGIVVADRRPPVDGYQQLLEIEMPEDAALLYETTESGFVPRTFCIPAEILNQHIGVTPRDSSMADSDDD